eukprot:CAMPEP_0179431124 /NCGR_PEP_ID=MMETSP0799-20121207/16092_1 /TAXON_ID=46947 /ORGANISM="Geminigera cryophila, Strain CCMP2564" /LENGTH=47 /DNA_ID= /DNA_START= /DNA_END= /DNA_ORIENTATION=
MTGVYVFIDLRRRAGAERDSGADGEFGEGTRKHVAQPPSAHYNASNA